MSKRLVDIDDDMLEQARRVLGTLTIKDTVNTALEDAVRAAARRQRVDGDALRRFAEATQDLGDPEVMAGAWE